MKIILATHNKHKITEIKAVLQNLNVDIRTLNDFPEIGEIPETGSTLEENALLKARTVNELTGLPAIGDDTGLEVDALDGAPGVYSARYAGEKATYQDNVNKLLNEKDEYTKLVLVGLISLLLIQTFIHIGVNIRLLPTTGITLPFLSYGGSSIVGNAIVAGLILNLTKKIPLNQDSL